MTFIEFLTCIEIDLEFCRSAKPAGVLVGDVAPELAAIRQPDVGDLEKAGRHDLHSVIDHQRLLVLQPGDGGRRGGRHAALEDRRLAEEEADGGRLAVETR